MKKFVLIFGFIIVGVLFLFQYDNYNNAKYYQMLSLPTYLLEVDDSKPQTIEIGNFKNEEDMTKTFFYINELSNTRQLSLIVRQLISSDTPYNVNRYYMYTVEHEVLKKLNLKQDDFLPFDNTNLSFYYSSNSKDDKKTNQILSFNEDYFIKESETIEIFPLVAILKNRPANKVDTFWISVSGENNKQFVLDELEKVQTEENIDFSFSDTTENQHYWSFDELLTLNYSTINEVFLICLIIFIISSCCMVSKNNKELIIRKMHGETTLHIMKTLYIKFFVGLLLGCLTLHFILWCLFINSFKNIYSEFNQMYLQLVCYYGLFVVVMLIVIYFYINITANIKHLKKGTSISTILKINILLKIGISLFMITPFLFMAKVQLPAIDDFLFMINNKNDFENDYIVGAVKSSSLETLLTMYPYADFTMYATMGNAIEMNFPELNDEQVKKKKMEYPYIVVNDLYLENTELFDTQGGRIDYSTLDNNTLLIPEKLKGKNLDMYCKQENCSYIFIKNSGEFINKNPLGQIHRVKNPIIHFIKENNYAIVNHQGFIISNDKNMTKREYESYLNTTLNIQNTVLMSSAANYTMYLERTEKALFSVISMFIVYSLIYILFLIQFLNLYFEKNKKEMVIQYLMGQSYIQRYGNLILIDLVIYGLVTTLSILLLKIPFKDIRVFILPVLLLDLIIQILYIFRFHRKNAVSVLKGDI